MNILLVAYYFPPDGGAGTQRPASFARHFARLGHECTVLTRTPPGQRSFWEPEDRTLLTEASATTRVIRTPPAPDISAWLRLLEQATEAQIRTHQPDIIVVTMSPFEAWRPSWRAASRMGVPIVFDLRDPWALDGWQSYRTYAHWLLERREMQRMLRAASGVVANTPECRGLFHDLEPSLAHDRIEVVTNGWEQDDFPDPAPIVAPGENLRLVFTGTFLTRGIGERGSLLRRCIRRLRYAPEPLDPTGRTPIHLLAAIRGLRESGDPSGQRIRLVVVGQPDAATRRCVEASGAGDAVEFLGYQPHSESVRLIRHADALFLPLHGLPTGHRSRIVPGKAYEYLATGRPIVGALPEGDAREIIEASGRGFIADPCSAESLAQCLRLLFERWRSGAFVESVRSSTARGYERGRLAERLCAFLHRVRFKQSGRREA